MSAIGPGDVVVCVFIMDGDVASLVPLVLRKTYRVTDCGPDHSQGTVWLDLSGFEHPNMGYDASQFHKIDAADDAFIANIRKRQPVEA
jgi:hypothetical protein